MFTPAQVEADLRATGGKTVVCGQQSTWGHVEMTPETVLEGEGGSGGVQAEDYSVVIANGILTGIDGRTGIDRVMVVDGVTCVVRDIGPVDRTGMKLRLMLGRI